ncbi:MAG: hypothetical protein ACK4UN_11100 [Limisphaerales bacterium]
MKLPDPIKPWFSSAEQTGEYIGIRFGRIPPGASKPEWIFLPHSKVDGIGGFADLLRDRGAEICRLPTIKHAPKPLRLLAIKNAAKFLKRKEILKWLPLNGQPGSCSNTTPPTAVAWHVFDETTTDLIRRACRKSGYTVNSFLLKHLTRAIRSHLEDQAALIPWMIPVNLRGKVSRETDIENHSSYITVKVGAYDTVRDIHRQIYAALGRGDHWANWFSYESSHILPEALRHYLVKTDKYIPVWHIGGFSNLGDWDPEKKWDLPECEGDWLFCPPVLRCQHLGAGCVTFQNRLTIMIQAHQQLTTSCSDPKAWVDGWVKEIQMDLKSLLPEPLVHA